MNKFIVVQINDEMYKKCIPMEVHERLYYSLYTEYIFSAH